MIRFYLLIVIIFINQEQKYCFECYLYSYICCFIPKLNYLFIQENKIKLLVENLIIYSKTYIKYHIPKSLF